ncbi:YceI family protein [Antarcticibacterium sp. 1MA-6-2]|uniref:YceI family protein n=1 Tax=Antarcticibacterium sp. 1MA-6-2 TaxID=2908210 RepID=UPI001F2100FF|nr:YceI family protein [Antarcticibacterium sp. 1MA-6-2]UJH91134.1 YceI family protein [Antarcticibacterium sp. 1MA-6-2]
MKKNVLKGATASVIILTTLSFTTLKKEIQIKESQVTWTGKKVTGSHTGTIQLKDGHFNVEDGKLIGGEFIIDMTSITVTDLSGDGKRDLEGHLKSEDFFGVENHPVSKLVITKVAKKNDNTYAVTGNLTIKNITHPINFDLDWKENSASTKLSIDRSKYNVKYGSGSFFQNLGDKTIYDNFDLEVDLKF